MFPTSGRDCAGRDHVLVRPGIRRSLILSGATTLRAVRGRAGTLPIAARAFPGADRQVRDLHLPRFKSGRLTGKGDPRSNRRLVLQLIHVLGHKLGQYRRVRRESLRMPSWVLDQNRIPRCTQESE